MAAMNTPATATVTGPVMTPNGWLGGPGMYASKGERKFGRAANTPASRAHKPTDADMGPHNWGGGEARPRGGAMRGRGRRG